MLCIFFNAVDSYRAVGVILKIFSLESKLMGFFCLNHVFHYHLVVLSLRPVLKLSASTWVLDSNSLSFSPSYLWLPSANSASVLSAGLRATALSPGAGAAVGRPMAVLNSHSP